MTTALATRIGLGMLASTSSVKNAMGNSTSTVAARRDIGRNHRLIATSPSNTAVAS